MAAVVVLVAVKDTAAAAFMRVFSAPANAAAIRSFRDEVNREDKDNAMYHHPDDFELYQLGTFDEDTGIVMANLQLLARAKDLREARVTH